MAQVVHPCSVGYRSIERSLSSPALRAPLPVPNGLQLPLPIQGVPVNRSEIPHPYMVDYGPFSAIPEASPRPDNHAYFSRQVDPRLSICQVLSGYAVARCFRAGGLF
jgi:hypothetical protein